MLLTRRLKLFLQDKKRLLEKSVLICKDGTTADILGGCLRELGIFKTIWSLYAFAALEDACLKLRLRELFGDSYPGGFSCNFQKYVKRLQWNEWKGDGELPLCVDNFKRQDGLLPDGAEPKNAMLGLPKGLQLLIQSKSAVTQKLQPILAKKMWQLHSLAQYFFLSSEESVTTPILLSDLKENRFTEDVDLGWTCVWLVCSRTKCLLSEKASLLVGGKCWGEVLSEQLDGAMIKLRNLMPWKCLPELSSLTLWSASDSDEQLPPVWVDLIDELDYHVEPQKALEELRLLDERLWNLMDEASRRCGDTIAIGMMNSLVLNYRKAVKVHHAKN
jgi:hypothetical protein